MYFFYTIAPLLASLFLLGLGLFIFISGLRVEKAYYKIVFAAGCICCFFWLFSTSIVCTIQNITIILLFFKIGLMGAIFTAMTFHHFIVLLLNRRERLFVILTYLIGIIFTVLLWIPNGLIEGFYKYSWGYYPDFTRLNLLSILVFAYYL